MRIILFILSLLILQTGLCQTNNREKLFQLYQDFTTVEDSIANRINKQNTIIYKTCEGYRSFYFIEQDSQWTGYYIKNLRIGGLVPPTIQIINNGEITKLKPYQTELIVFDADTIVQLMIDHKINEIQQLGEDSIMEQLSVQGKKKNQVIMTSLPYSCHDCNGTIIVYGQKNYSATYRGMLIDDEKLHKISTLKIFFDIKEILKTSMKNYG